MPVQLPIVASSRQYSLSKFISIPSKTSAGTLESATDRRCRRQRDKQNNFPLQCWLQFLRFPRLPGLPRLPCPWTAAATPAPIALSAAAPAKPPSTATAVILGSGFSVGRLNPEVPRPVADPPGLGLPDPDVP